MIKRLICLTCALVILLSCFTITASAYTWRGCNIAEDSADTSYSSWSEEDKKMLDILVKEFKKEGWTKNSICGVIANLRCEGWSMWDEDRIGVVEVNGIVSSVCGIACWTDNDEGARGRTNFLNWCKEKGKKWNDLATQAEYLASHMTCMQRTCTGGYINVTSDASSLKAFWDDIPGVENIKSVEDFGKFDFKKPEHAAEIWCWFFECPSIYYSHIGKRMREAKDLAENAPIDGASASSESDKADTAAISGVGFLDETAFVDTAALYDEPRKLPAFEDLGTKDQLNLREWTATLENEDEVKPFSLARAVVIFVGILITVYSTLLYVAFQFDRNQNYIEIRLLECLTLGRLTVSASDNESTFTSKNKEKKAVSHKDICVVCMIGISLGVLILSGKMFLLISWAVDIVKGWINS